MTRKQNQEYWAIQKIKDAAQRRHADAVINLKSKVNSNKESATSFFAVAGPYGAKDVLMTAAGVSSVNANHLISELTSEESVIVFSIIGSILAGDPLPAQETKLILIAQTIVLGYQLSSLEEAPHDPASAFNLQVQGDGSVVVADL